MPDDRKNPHIADLLNQVSGELAKAEGRGMTRSEALLQKKCQRCGQDVTTFKDRISEKEYTLTAWCQACQDRHFGA